jgi:hypothetical protein
MSLTIRDIHYWRVIESIGMAWETGAEMTIPGLNRAYASSI